MKALFLDIDGVLNSDPFLYEAHDASGLTVSQFRAEPWRHLCPILVRRMNRVIAETGATVVLSSDWRKEPRNPGLAGTQAALDRVGATFRLADATPYTLDEGRGLWGGVPYTPRWKECQAWLHAHPDVTAFAAVDDRDDFAGWMDRLVRTDDMLGLTEANADALIALLGRCA